MAGSGEKPRFDKEKAAALLGKRVLIGLTYVDSAGAFVEQKQLHGKVVAVHHRKGVDVELMGSGAGKSFRLPPEWGRFEAALSGEYELESTGEVVVDPDFTCEWTVDVKPPR